MRRPEREGRTHYSSTARRTKGTCLVEATQTPVENFKPPQTVDKKTTKCLSPPPPSLIWWRKEILQRTTAPWPCAEEGGDVVMPSSDPCVCGLLADVAFLIRVLYSRTSILHFAWSQGTAQYTEIRRVDPHTRTINHTLETPPTPTCRKR